MSLTPELKTVVIETTKRCNLHCRHCGSDCNSLESQDELTAAEWQLVIMEIADLGCQQIVFSGGEPFLKPQFEKMIRTAFKRGISYGVITNGIVLPDSYLELFSHCPPFAIGVSIDGGMETHNHIRQNSQAWLKSLQTITRLVNAGIPTVVNTTVSKLNCRELPMIAQTLDTLGVSGWQIQIAAPMGRMNTSPDIIDVDDFNFVCLEINRLRNRYPNMVITGADCFGLDSLGLTRNSDWPGCSAGIYVLGIMANGGVLPCLSMYDEKFVCANLRQQSLATIWNCDEYFKFNRDFEHCFVAENSHCLDCKKLVSCRGGCASASWSFNGNLHDAPFCVNRDLKLTINNRRK